MIIIILSLMSFPLLPCITAEDTAAEEDTNCTTPNETLGICIDIKYCQPLLSLSKRFPPNIEEIRFLKRSKCGPYVEVCCPMERNRTRNQSNENSGPVKGSGKTNVSGQKLVGETEADLDTNCTTPDRKLGICINLRSCQVLMPLLKFPRGSEEINFLRASKCGPSVEVCCPMERNRTINQSNESSYPVEGSGKTTVLEQKLVGETEADLDTNCTTPDRKFGICINLRSCQVLMPLLKFPRGSEEINFLRASICGSNYAEVCCPIERKKNPTIKHSNSRTCGKTTVLEPKVVGGTVAIPGAWPWIAVLGYRVDNDLIWGGCAGSLINDRYILTAAHCKKFKFVKVRLGEHNLRSEHDGAFPQDFNIEKFIVHNKHFSKIQNDIALIRLDKNVVFTDKIKPVCLPQAPGLISSVFEGKYPYAIGWGTTKFNGPSSDVLLQVQVLVIKNKDCGKIYGNNVITNNHICAGVKEGGKDTCQGDSGGPLMISEGGVYYQIGIISGGHGCAKPGYPGVYTRVTSYLEWINNNIK